MKFPTITKSSSELEHELEAARRAEREQAHAKAEADREHEREVAALRKRAAAEVASVGRAVKEARQAAKNATARPSRQTRGYARAVLLGEAPKPEIGHPVDELARMDTVAAGWLGASRVAFAALDRYANPLSDLFLPVDDEAIARLDDLEVEAWHGLMERARWLAEGTA